MAHDDRMLSQSEIDSLLKKILPKSDESATKDEPESTPPAESPAISKEATTDVQPVTSIKSPEPVKPKETVPAGREENPIKLSEYKMSVTDTPPSPRPAEVIKRELPSEEDVKPQKKITDMPGQVSKPTASTQEITQLEEKVKQLEAMVKMMSDSNRMLKARIDEISNVLNMLQDNKSDYTFFENFKCSHCRSEGLVALYAKCTSCGKESWMGWWPDREDK